MRKKLRLIVDEVIACTQKKVEYLICSFARRQFIKFKRFGDISETSGVDFSLTQQYRVAYLFLTSIGERNIIGYCIVIERDGMFFAGSKCEVFAFFNV